MQRAFGGDHHTAGPPSSSSSGDVFDNHQPYYADQSFHDPNQYNNYPHHHPNHFAHFNGGPAFASGHHAPFPGRKRTWQHSNQDNVNFGKLYVARVPRTATEQDIQSVFGQYGSILEVVLLKDKNTGHQQGSCFVKYATALEANNAVAALNNNYTFPGEMGSITVKFANNRERERTGIMVQEKVYVTMLNKEAPIEEIEEIFSTYGAIEEVYIVRDEMKQSRGCGFVKFTHIDMAHAAIEGLNGNYTMRGCDRPLIVRFAEPRKHRPGEFRNNGMYTGTNFGADHQESNFRQKNYHGDSMFGFNQPKPMHTMQQFSSTSQPNEALNQESQQYYQKPLQQIPNPDSTSQFYQPTSVPDSQKQECQIEENQVQYLHQQHSQTSGHQPPPTRSGSQEGAGNSAVSSNLEEILECDWSEHTCPDGYKYYYNCVTCESLWDKPKEYALYEEQLNKQNPGSQNHQQSPIISPLNITQSLDDEEQKAVLPEELQLKIPSMPILDRVEVQ